VNAVRGVSLRFRAHLPPPRGERDQQHAGGELERRQHDAVSAVLDRDRAEQQRHDQRERLSEQEPDAERGAVRARAIRPEDGQGGKEGYRAQRGDEPVDDHLSDLAHPRTIAVAASSCAACSDAGVTS
jgi:hypothetical protein